MAGKKAKKSRKFIGFVTAIFFAVMAVAMLPTTIMIVVGLIPSGVAYFADTSKTRDLGPTVLAMNIAGLVPSVLKLWHIGPSVMKNALTILTEPLMLLVILLPSGFGWMLFYIMPHLISGIMRRKAEGRIRNLEKMQQELVTQWGNPVTHLVAPVKTAAPPVPETATA